MKATPGWAGLAAAVAIVAGGPATADLLVTREGQVIETRGSWEVRGKLLVFELPDGTLASLRLDEADLEASGERNREAAERARQALEASRRPPPEPLEATVVITDGDVAPAPPLAEEAEPGAVTIVAPGAGAAGGADAATGDAGEGDTEGPAATSSAGVQVVEWSQEPEGEIGLAVRGVVENLGSSFATGVSVNALFYDEIGTLVAAREVALEDGPLGPGARREFSLSLPDSLVYDEIKFLVVGRGFHSVGQSVRSDGQF